MLAIEVDNVLGPHPLHDLDCFTQLTDPSRGLREGVPVTLVLVLIPSCPDPHLEPAAGYRVDRRRNRKTDH